MNVKGCSLRPNPELDASNNFELSWIYGNGGGRPVREISCADFHLVGCGWLYVGKFEKPAFGGDECKAFIAFRGLENNRRIGYGITVHIDNRSYQLSWLRLLALQALSMQRYGKHQG